MAKITTELDHWFQLVVRALLYVYDTENELQNRITNICPDNSNNDIDGNIVQQLIKMFDDNNKIVKIFRMARERFRNTDIRPIRIRLCDHQRSDGPQYDLPSQNEVAGLIEGDLVGILRVIWVNSTKVGISLLMIETLV